MGLFSIVNYHTVCADIRQRGNSESELQGDWLVKHIVGRVYFVAISPKLAGLSLSKGCCEHICMLDEQHRLRIDQAFQTEQKLAE